MSKVNQLTPFSTHSNQEWIEAIRQSKAILKNCCVQLNNDVIRRYLIVKDEAEACDLDPDLKTVSADEASQIYRRAIKTIKQRNGTHIA